jgi:hypothetical protein
MIVILSLFSLLILMIILSIPMIFIIRSTKNRKGKMGINLNDVNCPGCDLELPYFRIPKSFSQVMFGGNTCPNCGCEVDKWGKRIK